MKRICLFIVMLTLCVASAPGKANADTPLTLDPYLTGLSSPILILPMPGDTTRELVVEQGGRIRLIENGVIQPNFFLDIQSRVRSGGEQGLLGLAFHPDFANNRYVYVYYTAGIPDGQSTVERFTVYPDLDSADINSDFVIFTQSQPAANHNAGMIDFGPDGYLYIALGDGGGAGDTDNNAQTRTTFLGKMLRIDVDGGSPYAVPPDNPFVGDPATLDEIWAIGLRNPWRWCFDGLTGDLWIADVGQGDWEEVNFAPASDTGGLNYGWRLKEGDNCYNPSTNCDPLDTLYDPIHEYSHSLGCSITGGFVYRGCAVPDLDGAYFFGDYCSGRIWSFKYDGSSVLEFTERTSELGNPGFGLVSFGYDYQGELYLVYSDGDIFKLVPDGVPSQCGVEPCCSGPSVGNVDGSPDDAVTLGDLTVLIDHLFISLAPLDCPEEGNTDESPGGEVTLGDLTVLIDHLFISLDPLPACPA
ncbi:glucose dehydrogenase [candidate division GN15 bacterium]|nr:glucose dehydrogenase [candidate division GN15 bacterium]